MRVPSQDCRQELSPTPTYIDERAKGGEVVGDRGARVGEGRRGGHGLAEEGGLLGMLVEVVEGRHPVHHAERRLPGPHRRSRRSSCRRSPPWTPPDRTSTVDR